MNNHDIAKNIMDNLKKVEKILCYEFNNKNLLKKALTHPSYNSINHIDNGDSYQRMEYLGDALLDFIVADELYKNFPEFDEGDLSKIRASVVSKGPLARIVEKSGIVNYIMYDKQNTALSDKLKSDIFESLIAAMYLDSNGIKTSKNFIIRYIKPLVLSKTSEDLIDYKTKLNEFCGKHKLDFKFMLDRQDGPDHDLVFYFNLYVNGELIANECGKSHKQAEQKCSKVALEKLGEKYDL